MHGLGDHDELGRVLPGSARGWGVSWWLHEQGVTQEAIQAMSPEERLALQFAYFEASNDGWEPAVARDDRVGPHHFDDPAPPLRPNSRLTGLKPTSTDGHGRFG